MKTIKFSHLYTKLLDEHNDAIEKATLLGVFPIKLEELSEAFKSYDTDNGIFSLPTRGEYLMLVFLKPRDSDRFKNIICSSDLFTTLRRSTPHKLVYYKGAIGETFKMVIKGV